VILARARAERLGLGVGDVLAVATTGGLAELEVAGVVERSFPARTGEAVLVGWGDALERFGVLGADAIAIRYEPGRAADASAAVDAFARERALTVAPVSAVEGAVETSAMSADEFNVDLIKRAKFLLIDGRELETSLTAAMLMHKSGGEVILDVGSPRKNISDVLPHVDHLVASNRFSIDFTQEVDPGKAALKLAHIGFKSVVITSGSRLHRGDRRRVVLPAGSFPGGRGGHHRRRGRVSRRIYLRPGTGMGNAADAQVRLGRGGHEMPPSRRAPGNTGTVRGRGFHPRKRRSKRLALSRQL
jgi:hypothetical protein